MNSELQATAPRSGIVILLRGAGLLGAQIPARPRYTRRLQSHILLASLLALMACSRGGPSGNNSDSANTTAIYETSPTPIVIATITRPTDTLGGFVGATRLRDGGTAVGHGANASVVFADSLGRITRAVSLPRFANTTPLLTWLGRCPGRNLIAVRETAAERYLLLNEAGDLVLEAPLPRGLMFASVLACPSDGTLLLINTVPSRFPTGTGVTTSTAHIVRLNAAKGTADTIRTFPGSEYFYSAKWKTFSEQPLGIVAVARAVDSLVFYGRGSDPYLEYFNVGETSTRRLTHVLPTRPASTGDIISAVAMRLQEESFARTRSKVRLSLRESPIRGELPRFDAMVRAEDGRIWLRSFATPRWDRVEWRSIWPRDVKSTLLTPPDLVVTEIGANYVLGIRRGTNRPEEVVRYLLVKSDK